MKCTTTPPPDDPMTGLKRESDGDEEIDPTSAVDGGANGRQIIPEGNPTPPSSAAGLAAPDAPMKEEDDDEAAAASAASTAAAAAAAQQQQHQSLLHFMSRLAQAQAASLAAAAVVTPNSPSNSASTPSPTEARSASTHEHAELLVKHQIKPETSTALPLLVNGCSKENVPVDLQQRQQQHLSSVVSAPQQPQSEDGKKVHNNNTNSYMPGGGRLKFFKDGRCLLELSHRNDGDSRGDVWVPITKKVYWPPSASAPSPASTGSNNAAAATAAATTTVSNLVKSESSAASVSDSASNADGNSIPSPWQPGGGSNQLQQSHQHRAVKQPHPRRLRLESLPEETRNLLTFYLRPHPRVVALRRKVRGLRRRRRRPCSEPVAVGAQLLLFESRGGDGIGVPGWAKKGSETKRIMELKKDRLKSVLNRMEKLPALTSSSISNKKSSAPLVTIQSYSERKATKTKTSSEMPSMPLSSHPPPAPPGPPRGGVITVSGGVTRVKSELCPVTETCTAATLPNPSASQGNRHGKSKSSSVASPASSATSERSSSLDGARLPLSPHLPVHSMGAALPSGGGAKALPITPTMARIKSDMTSTAGSMSSSATIVSPDLQRVKLEVGTANSRLLQHHLGMPTSTSPVNLNSPDFISPRKRLLMQQQGVENGSPAAKRHRLSTDSRGSGGSSEGGGGGGPGSPHQLASFRLGNAASPARAASASPFAGHHLPASLQQPAAAASPPRAAARSSSFSIDSIISRDDASTPAKPAPVRPIAVPASPARLSTEAPSVSSPMQLPPPPPARTPATAAPRPKSPPLIVPVSPYTARGGVDAVRLDPRLAHLAGVSADPRLGLTPTGGPGFPFANPSMAAAAAAAAAAAMNPYYAAAAAAAQSAALMSAPAVSAASHPVSLAAAAGLWTPPVATAVTAGSSPSLSSAKPSSSSSTPVRHAPIIRTTPAAASSLVSASSPRLMGNWPPQYRGEPRVDAPASPAMDTSDAPLNLSTRR